MDYELKVKLPSKGMLYPDNPELSGDITLRMMTTDDEKIVFGGSMIEDATSALLKSCIVSPSVDPDILHPVDREFLLMKLRIHTYGNEYYITAVCPECGKESEFKVDLDDLEVKQLADDFREPFSIELPLCKKTIGMRLLKYGDLKRINKKAQDSAKKLNRSVNEIVFLEKIIRRIVTIDGEMVDYVKATEFVKSLYGKDSAYISYKLNQILFGYDFSTEVVCPNNSCRTSFKAGVDINTEFFRPRFD